MQDMNDELLRLIERYEAELAPLSDEVLDRRPADGGWTALEAIGHLTVAVELYNEKLSDLIARAPEKIAGPTRPHKPNWVARLLLGLLRREGAKKKKVGAPKVFRPDRTDRVYTVAGLIAVHRTLHEHARAIDARGLGGRRIATPISRFVKLKARDAVEVQLRHGRRHLEQALAAAEASQRP